MDNAGVTIPVVEELPVNSGEYFRKALIKPTGFREYDVRWLVEKELNYNGVLTLGAGYGTLLRTDFNIDEIIVGHDFRQYSENIKNAFVVGLLGSGMKVVDIGLCVSPGLYFAQHHLGIKGGAMVTASHNKNGWTGIKLGYGLSQTLGPDGIARFKEIVYSGKFLNGNGTYRSETSIAEAYSNDLLKKIERNKKLKIVVATGNGTAGLFTPKVLRRGGHDVIDQHVDLDWNFPNFNPNPEDVSFLKDIGNRVRQEQADIGIGIDGDGDRLGVVDERGEEVYSDKIGLLLARDFATKHSGALFIVDVKSTGLFKVDDVLSANHCSTIYWKTGHSYLKSKVREEKALAGFEKSGHFFFNEPLGRGYDDGTLSAIHFCNFLSRQHHSVSELLAGLPLSYQTPTMAPFCEDTEKYSVVDRITGIFQKVKDENGRVAGIAIDEIITVNGVRVHYEDKSWGLVRASSNKPSLVVVAESFTTRKRLYDIIDDITGKLDATGKVGTWDQYLPAYPGED